MGFFDLFKDNELGELEKELGSLKRKYEAAARSRRTKNWHTGNGDSNEMIRRDLPWLRERSRFLRRNNPYAHKAIELVTNNVVGKGIMTQINDDPDGGANQLWKDWAGTTQCDYEGRHNLADLQRIAMDAIVESGEIIIRKRFINDPEFPIKYQLLESDFLDTNKTDRGLGSGNFIMQGIEFGPDGKRVAYHLFENHPGSSARSNFSLTSNRIPADQIYHLFRLERPGQVRGVPWLSPCMIRLRDLDGFEDAQLMRAKIASLFVAFVRDISADFECEDTEDLGERMVPGMIDHLPPGKSIEFADPPTFENYKEFVGSQLRGIAAGLGLTYEALANDLSETNFSSGRMGWIEMDRNVQSWRKCLMISGFMSNVESDFKLMALLRGRDYSTRTFEHVAPRRELIDPEKELKAIKMAIRSGLESRSGAIQSLGRDPDVVYKQIDEDNKKADDLKLILDTDARYTNNSGGRQDNGVTNETDQD